jgi:hypothetical protein
MPVTHVGSRQDNIEKSVNAYTKTKLDSISVPVFFTDQERFGALPPKWVECDFIWAGQISMLDHGPNLTIGAVAEFYLNLGVFLKEQDGLQTIGIYVLPTLVAEIVQFYDVPVEILVRDYLAVGTPIVGNLTVSEKVKTQRVPTAPDSGIRHANISVRMRYQAFTSY